MCIAVVNECKNLIESYGEICVMCNKCGRFNKTVGSVREGNLLKAKPHNKPSKKRNS